MTQYLLLLTIDKSDCIQIIVLNIESNDGGSDSTLDNSRDKVDTSSGYKGKGKRG